MPDSSDVSLVLPTERRYISVATLAAKAFAEGLGFGEEANHIGLAMEEAMVHALEFGYGGRRDTIEIGIRRTAVGIRLQARFRGLPLHMEELPKYDLDRALNHGDATGISSHLIEQVMDRSAFSVQPEGMRLVSMEKRLPAELVAAEPARPPKSGESGEGRYALRAARPEDAEGISRLAFQSHDAVLFSESIYYPTRVAGMLETGTMVSVVAEESESNRIVGHGALVKQSPEGMVEELTYGIVDRRYRKRGCSVGMVRFLEENARERNIYAVLVFAVTNHPHSQHAVHNLGYRESGLFLDTTPASCSWGEGDADSARIGNVILVKYMDAFSRAPLHPPAHHREMIERIYAHLGVSARFAEDEGESGFAAETEIWSMTERIESWTLIWISRYGADAAAQVQEIADQALAEEIASVQLFLPLDDPLTGTLCARFEDMGFFFAGVAPGDDGREGLLLQRVHSEGTAYDAVHVHSAFAGELKEYVRACDPRERGEQVVPPTKKAAPPGDAALP